MSVGPQKIRQGVPGVTPDRFAHCPSRGRHPLTGKATMCLWSAGHPGDCLMWMIGHPLPRPAA